MRMPSGAWLAALAATASIHAGGTVHVDDDALAGGDGLTWATAFQHVDDALAAAERDPGVEAIWVAAGTYAPTHLDDPDEPRSASFVLVDGVAVYGGFAGDERSLEERDPIANPTVLTADLLGDDRGGANLDDNAWHVVRGAALGPDTRLDGFVITGGRAIDGPSPERDGAGIRLVDAELTVARCIVSENAARDGGGLFVLGGEAAVEDSHFLGNDAGCGGAIACESGQLVVDGCQFDDNAASSSNGGGAICGVSASMTLAESSFKKNVADDFGGAVASHSSETGIIDCDFLGNSADRGGAIFNGASSANVSGSVFLNNSAYMGGAVCDLVSTVASYEDCEFRLNAAQTGATAHVEYMSIVDFTSVRMELGLADESGAAIAATKGSDVLLRACTLLDNFAFAGAGGGIFATGSSVTIESSVVGSGWAPSGGAIHVEEGMLVLDGVTVASNDAGGGPAGVSLVSTVASIHDSILWGNGGEAAGESDQVTMLESALTVNTTCVQGLTGALDGVGNIGLDPMLADDEGHLSSASPCIDAGGATLAAPGATDVDGEARVFGCRVDMGADETAVDLPSADCDENGVDDDCDLQDPQNDCDADGVVDSCQGLADCDGDGVTDLCQTSDTEVDLSSGPFGTVTPTTIASFIFRNVPPASDDVIARVGAVGDFLHQAYVSVYLDGILVLDELSDITCALNPTLEEIVIDAELFNALAADGTVEFTFIPSPFIGESCDDTYATADLLYATPAPSDCDGNGVPDVCDLDRPSGDCNGNGVLDTCEPGDCNGNGVLDACELVEGLLPDCNGNGIADTCDVQPGVATFELGPLSPVDGNVSHFFAIPDAPLALDDVVITLTAHADLGNSAQSIAVRLNGQTINALFGGDGHFCIMFPDAGEVVVPVAQFNAAVESGDVLIELDPSPNVDGDECLDSWMSVAVAVPSASPLDADGSGVPDACEMLGDLDGNGVVDGGDLGLLLGAWGEGPSPADLDGNGVVNGGDLGLLLGNWS